MSMGTGLPSEGWECANLAGGGAGTGLARTEVEEQVDVVDTGTILEEA